jgi:anti-anti-sigma regulatory factor
MVTPVNVLRHSLHRLSGAGDVIEAMQVFRKAMRDGIARVEIDASDVVAVYPNGAVPFAAIVDSFKTAGLDIRFTNVRSDTFFEHTRTRSPLVSSPANLEGPASRLSLVWAYTEETAVGLADCIIEELSHRVEFGTGVLSALNWCLYEVLDNVFQHSKSETGFFMAQLLKTSRRLLFSVADAGIGVHRSFYLGKKYHPPTAFDSLTLAVRQGVSSTGDRRGNGLFGLKGVIEANGGQLDISSGRAYLRISPGGIDGRNGNGSGLIIDNDHHCTIVDFSLDVSTPVDLGEVLGGPVIDARLEQIENVEGEHVIPLIEHAQGTGTRAAAERLRNYLINYINEGAPVLVLDFDGVEMVSSSFADETIGKLAQRFGFIGFTQKFRMVNMKPQIQMLLDRAVSLRISGDFYRDDRMV